MGIGDGALLSCDLVASNLPIFLLHLLQVHYLLSSILLVTLRVK